MLTIIKIIFTILTLIGLGLVIGGGSETSIAGATGAILLGLIVAHQIFSYKIVNVGEVGMMTIWGEPVEETLTPSWYFTPALMAKIRTIASTAFQDELPADPEKIFRGDGKAPDGMFPPIRVKFGQPGPTECPCLPTKCADLSKCPNLDDNGKKDILENISLKDDKYNVAMVAEVVPVVSWHVTDAPLFFKIMGDIENCRKIMADKATEVFGDSFAKMTPAKAALRLDEISKKLEIKLKEETEKNGWGIEIDDAYVKPIIFSHNFNESVLQIQMEKNTAEKTVIAAEAEKKRLVQVATGTAEAVVLAAAAEKERLVQVATGTAEAVVLAASAEKKRLVETGLATLDSEGNIKKLNPDANTRVRTEAVKALAKVTGTLVLGDPNVMLGINKPGGKE